MNLTDRLLSSASSAITASMSRAMEFERFAAQQAMEGKLRQEVASPQIPVFASRAEAIASLQKRNLRRTNKIVRRFKPYASHLVQVEYAGGRCEVLHATKGWRTMH